MNANDKWNKLVQYHDCYFNSSEQTIQGVWENIFAELLNYSRLDGDIDSRLDGDIDSHRSIQIGSTQRTIPDIILRENNNDLFIVELKRHNMQLCGDKQLLSYLQLLHKKIGVLICNKIYIYDYDYNNHTNVQNVEIAFEKDNPDGVKFVELFSKKQFSEKAASEFINGKNELTKKVKLIQSEVNCKLLSKVVHEHFLENYTADEVEVALSSYSFNVTLKQPSNPEKIKGSDYPDLPHNLLGKPAALRLCAQNQVKRYFTETYASKNKTVDKYWANPHFECLLHDWLLMLDDCIKRELHVFVIQANDIALRSLQIRKDKPLKLDLQIHYADQEFEDSRSKIKFSKWHIKTISY